MEDLVTKFIEHHFDLLKYLSLFIGIAYSYYRRVIADRRSDQLDEERLNYVKSLTAKVIELQQHHDECSCNSPTCQSNHVTSEDVAHMKEDLEHTAKELRDTVEELKSRLDDVHPVSYNGTAHSKVDDSKKA